MLNEIKCDGCIAHTQFYLYTPRYEFGHGFPLCAQHMGYIRAHTLCAEGPRFYARHL